MSIGLGFASVTNPGGGSPPTPGSGIVIVANIAALEAFATAGLPTGSLAYVQTVGAYWSLDNGATEFPVDGITVVIASAGGRWLRFASGVQEVALLQGDWQIDPVAGNDENNGSSAPIKTLAERLRRFGTTTPTYTTFQTIELLGDVPSSDPWIEVPNVSLLAGGALIVTGTLTQVGTTSVTGYSSRNRAAGTKDKIQSSDSAAFWTPFVGKLVHDTTQDAWFWVNADAGASAALVSPPMGASASPPPWVEPLSEGDALVIFSPSKLTVLVGNAEPTGLQFQFLDIGGFLTAPNLNCDRCTFNGVQVFNAQSPGLVHLSNCDFGPTSTAQSRMVFWGGQARTGSNITLMGVSLDLASIADGDVLLDGTVYVEGNFRIGSAGFFGTYADKTRQPSAVVLETIDLTYGVAQWGTSSLDTAEGTQVGLGQAAVGSMLLTGGYTIDGSGTAAQYDPAAGTFATGVAVTPANVDAKGNLQNPVTGSRVFRRS